MKPELKKLTNFLDKSESPTLYLSRREVEVIVKEVTWMSDRIERVTKLFRRHRDAIDGLLGGEG